MQTKIQLEKNNSKDNDKTDRTPSQEVGSQPPQYWLSLEQWREDESFKELAQREFMSSPFSEKESLSESLDHELGDLSGEGGWARREFLQLMGASLALSTFGCVRRPIEKIIPYVNRPKEIIPGLPNFYASSFVDGGSVVGTVVRTREGRPIKMEGNEFYPGSGQALSARGQAQVLSLYDPDRLTGPVKNLVNSKRTNSDRISIQWAAAKKALKEAYNKKGLFILSASNPSPSSRQLIKRFVGMTKGEYIQYDALDTSTYRQSFAQSGHLTPSEFPRFDLEQADVIVGIDSDYLGTGIDSLAMQRAFSKRRQPNKQMSHVVQFESMMTLTGMNADLRFPIRPSEQLVIAMKLVDLVSSKLGLSFPLSWRETYNSFKNILSQVSFGKKVLEKVADQLIQARGRSLVLTGSLASMTQNQKPLYDVVNYLNGILGNEGKTIPSSHPIVSHRGAISSLTSFIEKMELGQVKSLIIHNCNPLYTLPQSSGFHKALSQVETVFYTGDRSDETGKGCDYIFPDHHSLEKWSDYEGAQGVLSIAQPTIQPLYQTQAFEDLLLATMGDSQSWFSYLKQNLQGKIGRSSSHWVQFLQKGVSGDIKNTSGLKAPRSPKTLNIGMTEASDFELVLYPTVGLKEGTLANVSWLQEFPDPVTKICWDNYVCMSPGMALKASVKEGDVVSLKVGESFLKVPVHIQPGLNDKVLALAVGYGRTHAGHVANNVGVNAYELAEVQKDQIIYSGRNVSFKKTMEHIPLANVQGHHSMEGRQIVVETTLKEILKNPQSGQHKHKVFSLWSPHKYKGHKWGMAIDLNACNGCGACIVACQSENNIPVVGKNHVLNGREMHWLRVDRYYTGPPENPDVVVQPVMCMHCDNAPCETVCPVLATVHSDEGTNDMVYNRCVGTRYCANNCPYKVRRFNWFNYSQVKTPLKMALNPEVTVRSRGVMEKCTFCVQRIKAKKTEARLSDRQLKDQEIKTACQQTCPTEAIIFGDLNDPSSEVSKKQKSLRSYALLEELAVYPAVKYMGKVRHVESLKGRDH